MKLQQNDQEKNEIIFVNLKWLIDANKSGSLPNRVDSNYFIGSTDANTSLKEV